MRFLFMTCGHWVWASAPYPKIINGTNRVLISLPQWRSSVVFVQANFLVRVFARFGWMLERPIRKPRAKRHRRRSFRLGEKRNAVGERVRALRKHLKLTQEMLAAKCAILGWEVDRQIVAHIESGSREVSDLELRVFCFALKVTPNDLLAWSE